MRATRMTRRRERAELMINAAFSCCFHLSLSSLSRLCGKREFGPRIISKLFGWNMRYALT